MATPFLQSKRMWQKWCNSASSSDSELFVEKELTGNLTFLLFLFAFGNWLCHYRRTTVFTYDLSQKQIIGWRQTGSEFKSSQQNPYTLLLIPTKLPRRRLDMLRLVISRFVFPILDGRDRGYHRWLLPFSSLYLYKMQVVTLLIFSYQDPVCESLVITF